MKVTTVRPDASVPVIGDESIIAAGAVVREGAEIPPRSLVAGVPGKVRREVTDEELATFAGHVRYYWDLARRHLEAP